MKMDRIIFPCSNQFQFSIQTIVLEQNSAILFIPSKPQHCAFDFSTDYTYSSPRTVVGD
jgi:hypothetical protein